MNIKNELKELYSLKHIIRYNNIPRIQNESVAEHSFFVSLVVARLHKQYNFNLEKTLLMAVVHDIFEIWISDVPRNIKARYKKLDTFLNQIENDVIKNRYPEYEDIINQFNDCSTVEGLICKYADSLSILQYAENEVKLGNKNYMPDVIKSAKKTLKKLEKKLQKYKK